jgi:hypothetical protein
MAYSDLSVNELSESTTITKLEHMLRTSKDLEELHPGQTLDIGQY